MSCRASSGNGSTVSPASPVVRSSPALADGRGLPMSTASRNRNRRCAKSAGACPAALMCCTRKAKGWKLASASIVAVSSVSPAPAFGSVALLAGRRWNCSACLPAPELPKPYQRRFPARWRALAALGYLTTRNARFVAPASSCQACYPLRWHWFAVWALPVGSPPPCQASLRPFRFRCGWV